MKVFKIVTKASLATVVVVIGLAMPANADNESKKCTYGANNRVVCTTSGSGSSRSSSSSSSSRTTTNVNVNVSEKDVENLFRGIFNNRNQKPSRTNQNSRQNNIPEIPRLEHKFK